jgi:tetratricopeptide (TPR) repeat protein
MGRLETLLEYLRDEPGDPFVLYALAQEYLKRGRIDEALRHFETLVTDHPGYVGTYYHLGKLYERLDRNEDALATYRAGMEAAQRIGDFHARAELQSALLDAHGVGSEDDEF